MIEVIKICYIYIESMSQIQHKRDNDNEIEKMKIFKYYITQT